MNVGQRVLVTGTHEKLTLAQSDNTHYARHMSRGVAKAASLGKPRGLVGLRMRLASLRHQASRSDPHSVRGAIRGSNDPSVSSLYQLPDCLNLDSHPSLRSHGLVDDFVTGYELFKEDLVNAETSGEGQAWFKFGDGDYHFLKQSEVGSARPGTRAVSKSYSEIDHQSFIDGSVQCTRYMCEVYPRNRAMFAELMHGRQIDYWAEYAYASVASRWVTSTFSGRIGIIGAAQKLELIQELLTHPMYQDYLHLDDFCDYITIPQQFACDDLADTVAQVGKQLMQAQSTLFLVGIGHVKSGLLWQLPRLKPAIYLDVGSGIDALAGIIDRSRPFFGAWANFRLPETSAYRQVDFLQLSDPGNLVLLKRPFSVPRK